MRIALVALFLTFLGAGNALAQGYPGSCFPLRFSLPEPSTDEPFIASGVIELNSSPGFGNSYSYSIYRKACAGGGAALLMRLKSLGIPTGEAPRVSIIQGSATESAVRYSTEPYTVRESVARGEDIDLGRVVIFNSNQIDFTKAMIVRVEGRSSAIVNVPDFNPDQYPEASAKLPIAGYLSGSYYNPQRSGEGMLIEIDPREIIVVAWYTFNSDGTPLWLIGSGPVCSSAVPPPLNASASETKVVCPYPPETTEIILRAFDGGGFAGQFDPADVRGRIWGYLRLEWENCSSLKILPSKTSTDSSLPDATGVLNWTRLTSIQYASC